MISLINAGNTHVRIRSGADGTIRVVPTAAFTRELIPPGPCAAASVVPAISALLEESGVLTVNPGTVPWLDLSRMEHPNRIGADRLANAAALADDGRLPALTLDFGTAVNCETVDTEGRFLGGAILPGRLLMRRALSLYTAQLPQLDLTDDLPAYPGKSTLPALRLGTDGALLWAAEGIIRATRELFTGRELRIVCCGGDADYFAARLPGVENGGPDFTFRGIEAVWRRRTR